MAPEKLRNRIEEKAGESVVDLRPFASGNNASLYLIDLKSGQRLVAKVARHPDAQLDLEGWMLKYLKANSRLPVPQVVWVEKSLLVMTYLGNSNVIDVGAEREAAELLAELHSVRAPYYGLEKDTLIGPLHQPNAPGKDWVAFFRDHRLLHMAKAAYEEKRIDEDLMRMIEKLAGKLDRYIDSSAPPSLLHGDLWGGNIMTLPGKITGFIDPAIYYGDPEIELAFSTLFGTFGERFFKRYGEIRPIREGFFETRRDLYNLYPLLVHARLFGRSYAQSVQQIVQRLAA